MPRAKAFDEDQTLEKAMTLFWEKGFAATSIQDLVQRLGINRASLYDTYGGKDALFKKSLERYLSTNQAALKHFLANEPDVKIGIQKILVTAANECTVDTDKKGCFVVNTTTELIPGDDELQAVLTDNKRTIEGLFYDYLLKGEAEGQIPKGKNLKAIASLIFTYYSGLKVVGKVEADQSLMDTSTATLLSLLD